MTFSDNEPAITAGTVVAIVTALLGLGAAFGLPLTENQQAAILGVIGVTAPIVVALLIRPNVTPMAKVHETVAEERVKEDEREALRENVP